MILSSTATITRPGDTTTYNAGDLIANSTTAGSVTPMSFGVSALNGGRGRVFRVSLHKADDTVTAASFKVHLFSSSPTVTNGDNGALAVSSLANYLGAVAIDQSSGGTVLAAATVWKDATVSPAIGFGVPYGGSIYGLLEAVGGYAPAASEVFTVTLDIEG